jgi:hypothetical protein
MLEIISIEIVPNEGKSAENLKFDWELKMLST